MKLIRTLIAFALGVVVGYAIRAWDIQLPDEVAAYAHRLEEMKQDKARLEAELSRLRRLVGEVQDAQ